jgi:predicted DCC family thiol-disulfide oxidoreductase YuxK
MSGLQPATTLLFYDGLCGLCDRLVKFVLLRDSTGRIRFAALQSPAAREFLLAHGKDPDDLDTVYAVAHWKTPKQRLLVRSHAVIHAVGQLGGGWLWLARAVSVVPRPVADLGYALVGRIRYRVFGRYDECQLPPPEWRERFLDRQEQ